MSASTSNNAVMMICPNLKCRKVLQVPARYRGQQVRCHHCGTTFAVPTQKAAATEGKSAEAKS